MVMGRSNDEEVFDDGMAAADSSVKKLSEKNEGESRDKAEFTASGMGTVSNATPHASTVDMPTNNTTKSNNAAVQDVSVGNSYGRQNDVSSSGNFPAVGSILGPFFCVGKLGKGTFCSIHKCINLHYFHGTKKQQERGLGDSSSNENAFAPTEMAARRVAAAKVEVGEFRNSGVLAGEAAMLEFLDRSLPKDTVPFYMGHCRGVEDVSAILMEYLPGQDMHQIRDWATKQKSRRISIQDAVYLTADVMLPLLQRMHQVGIVHRDVKPSNCVKRGMKDFAMVDFGLSKSIVVPKDSPFSDPNHPWTGSDWMHRPDGTEKGYFRKERAAAEFRGTSMYASLRVHQSKDYCPRDDMWSLMYVFCDLVTGGLPWMSHAANRDREACRLLKERIHGEVEGSIEQTEQLLMGHEYHVALFRKYKGGIDPPEGDDDSSSSLPSPLVMSKDKKKVQLLRTVFDHLGQLSFWDIPDYRLIQKSIKGFLEGPVEDKSVPPIVWENIFGVHEKSHEPPLRGEDIPSWELLEHPDPLEPGVFVESDDAIDGGLEEGLSGEAADLARLPLELRFWIAQMEYNTLHHTTIAPHLALRDWFKVALPLLYREWNARKFEKGGHRTNDDGYRRELYLKLIDKCLKCADKFNHFRNHECVYAGETSYISCADQLKSKLKRRKIESSIPSKSAVSRGYDLIAISNVLFQLRIAKKAERGKTYAPPPRLSFG